MAIDDYFPHDRDRMEERKEAERAIERGERSSLSWPTQSYKDAVGDHKTDLEKNSE